MKIKLDIWTLCLAFAIILTMMRIDQEMKIKKEVNELFKEITNDRTETLNNICECDFKTNTTTIRIGNYMNITEDLSKWE